MNTEPDDNDTVPRYMYDQVKVAYQRQRERTRKLRKERDELQHHVNTLQECLFQMQEAAKHGLERAQQEPATNAEEWLRTRYGPVRGHAEWRALIEAFNAGRAAAAVNQELVAAMRIEALDTCS